MPKRVWCPQCGCNETHIRNHEVEALREELTWALDVIRHEAQIPESCGACGTPNAQCGGECADAVYWAEHLTRIHALVDGEWTPAVEEKIVGMTCRAITEEAGYVVACGMPVPCRVHLVEPQHRERAMRQAAEKLLYVLGDFVRQSMYFNPEWKDGIEGLERAIKESAKNVPDPPVKVGY